MKKRYFILSNNEKRRLHDRAIRAQQADQSEICGVMTSDQHLRIKLYFVKNESDKAGSFSMSAPALAAARKEISKNSRMIGIFHSHVVSEAIPGSSDIQKARISHLQLIYDVCGREVRLWRIKRLNRRKVAVEVPLLIASRRS